MIKFKFDAFGFDKRISKPVLAREIGMSYITVYLTWRRGTMKPEMLTAMESVYGNLDKYIKK